MVKNVLSVPISVHDKKSSVTTAICTQIVILYCNLVADAHLGTCLIVYYYVTHGVIFNESQHLTSIVSKLLEVIIQQEIIKHLTENSIIADAQHGFRNNRSFLTNMFCYLNDLVGDVDKGNCIDANYMDCKKVFDRVPHQRPYIKSEKYLEAIFSDGLRISKKTGMLQYVNHHLSSYLHGAESLRVSIWPSPLCHLH